MQKIRHNLVLADDDVDDRIFFKEALEELPVDSILVTVNDGVELMHLLNSEPGNLPDVLFLDLNMPRKTGFECLAEIKTDKKLNHLPIIIFSTSFDHSVVNSLYEKGAHFYVRKPAEFSKLKEVIHTALSLTSGSATSRPAKENFILNSD
ncbi:MAG: response regulator [Ferruginibacter sp.]